MNEHLFARLCASVVLTSAAFLAFWTRFFGWDTPLLWDALGGGECPARTIWLRRESRAESLCLCVYCYRVVVPNRYLISFEDLCSGVDCLIAQLLIDAEQLIVFRHAIRSRHRAGFDLAGVCSDCKICDERIFALARAVGNHDAVMLSAPC